MGAGAVVRLDPTLGVAKTWHSSRSSPASFGNRSANSCVLQTETRFRQFQEGPRLGRSRKFCKPLTPMRSSISLSRARFLFISLSLSFYLSLSVCVCVCVCVCLRLSIPLSLKLSHTLPQALTPLCRTGWCRTCAWPAPSGDPSCTSSRSSLSSCNPQSSAPNP